MTELALVLTAGLGTRLRPLTRDRAKAGLPVAGEPLIRRILRWLRAQAVSEVVLNLHHRPETIAREVGDGSDMGLRVRYSWEPTLLGSAGGPRHAIGLLASERFLIVNGDMLTDPSLQAMADLHRESCALVTMALIANPDPIRYGGVEVSPDGWVRGFTPRGSATPGYHFVGVQIAEARTFADLADGDVVESVADLYPRLIARNPHAIRAFVCGAQFHDLGTLPDYLSTCLAVSHDEGGTLLGSRVRIAPDARLTRSVIWNDVEIGAGCELVESVVGDGARIPAGARFARSAIVRAGASAPGPDERRLGDLLVTSFGSGRRPEPRDSR